MSYYIIVSKFNGICVLLLLWQLLLLVIILLIIIQFSSVVITIRLILQNCILSCSFIKVNMLRILSGISSLSSQAKCLKFSIRLETWNENILRNELDRESVQCIMSLCCCTLIGKSMSSIGLPGERKLFCIQELVLVRNTLHA